MRRSNASCVRCGTPFYARPSQKRDGGGKYCCWECYAINTGKNAVYPKTQKCLMCGNEFVIKSHRYRKRKFCSQSCSAAHSNKNRVGIRYRKDSINSFSERLIEKYGHACMICGYDLFVDGHHIYPKSKGGSDSVDNGILLCPTHHREADRMVRSIEELFLITQNWVGRSDVGSLH